MNQPRSATAAAILIAALTTGFAPTAGAAGDSDVQELQREVHQLRAEVQSLQAVLLQAAELERRQSAVLNSTMDARIAAGEAAAPPPAAPPPTAPAVIARETTPPPAVSAAPEKKSRGGARNRRNKNPARSRSKAAR